MKPETQRMSSHELWKCSAGTQFWSRRRSVPAFAILTALIVLLVGPAAAQTESVLYSFSGEPDGASPAAAPYVDAHGNVYGTTASGGAVGSGTFFKLAAGATQDTVLHSFNGASDGRSPYSGIVHKGAFYGITGADGEFGWGTIYKVTASGKFTVLYNFHGGADGLNPVGSLAFDSAGNIYGTTQNGGNGFGNVYQLTPSGTLNVLHSFNPNGIDGYDPYDGVILDSSGNLYGTTANGGKFGFGTVYEITASGTEVVLYSFAGPPIDGAGPTDKLVRDKKGNLYGTTSQGGNDNDGTVFKLTPSGTETLLYSFTGPDGQSPFSPLVMDAIGNLFGTTVQGGKYGGGVVFEIPASGGESTVWNFNPDTGDGYYVLGGLTYVKSTGKLYGVTEKGGAHNDGTIFVAIP
jgi:uncharacterized repeat protein (TIGR03803 family)